MKGKTGSPVAASKKMKSMGRNLARAANQRSSAKVPMKFAEGGGIPKLPAAKDMGDFGGSGMDKSGFGAGKARGGKSTKGRKFSGSF